MSVLIVCLAGGAGAVIRFMVDGLIGTRLGRKFPWGTIVINITGALLLGTITALALRHDVSTKEKLVIGTGFCGGYTTFSTASFEAVRLLEEKRWLAAAAHTVANIGLSVLAAMLALSLTA